MNDGLVGVPKIEFYGNATDWKTLKSAEKCDFHFELIMTFITNLNTIETILIVL